jgi:hypothetical protein
MAVLARANSSGDPPRRRLGSSVAVWLWIGLSAGGCVTVDVAPDPVEALPLATVTVPFEGGGDGARAAVDAWYASIVRQMQDALLARDPAVFEDLLERHSRADAPAWARRKMQRFVALAAGLRFELHAAAAGVIESSDGTVVLGEPMPFEFRLRAEGHPDIELPDSKHAAGGARFLVSFQVQDFDCYGNRTERAASQLIELQRSVSFRDGAALELPFVVAALAPEGAMRRVGLMVELLPGNLLLAGEPIPNGRVPVARHGLDVYPRNVSLVRDHPFTNLRNALLLGDPAHFDHVYLAARFMPEEHREAAIRLLVRSVRLGSAVQGRVAMASLAVLTGASPAVGDRDGWLRWWQDRRDGDGGEQPR